MPKFTDVRLPVVQLVRISVDHHGATDHGPALDEASVGFPERLLTAVVGPSGAGKSTLLRCASGVERPSRGKVSRGSRELDAMNERELMELRGRYVPHPPALPPALTTYEYVDRGVCATDRTARRAAVLEALHHVGLEKEADRNLAGLSAEQRMRVAMAGALPAGPRVLFVDEPTDSRDGAGSRRITGVLRTLVEKAGRTVVVAIRDPAVAARADRAIFLVGGRFVGKIDRPTAKEVAAELVRRQP
ncbi:ATP-binding cassette domain-containing protein [Streptomyces sp. V2I9]|uniref:ATP-binding cassette domain-containing protein n=1 Tax=Streptomyces sp. V2I9 TaxID=3042304 RepID=UPI002784E8B3|nr:ATP-binding cassette domain-containing protein [Streptomyces sp. V2I9]MDQ0987586.1 putative ABC transport system ATP-binding protein [Streptomyces sp. V2I9]